MKITYELLKKMKACSPGLDFFKKNNLENVDSEKITGDYKSFLEWFNEEFPKYSFKGNEISYKDSYGYSWEKSYDEKGNEISYKDSNGVSWEKSYDGNGNEISFKDSYGFSWESSYDEKGNEVFYKDSYGFSWESSYDEKDRLTKLTKNDKTILKIEW